MLGIHFDFQNVDETSILHQCLDTTKMVYVERLPFPGKHKSHFKFFRKMTHISKFNDEVREESVFATPNPRTLGRGVRDFYSERDAAATPRRFTTVATPMSRKIKVQ